jgi:hypothetical protein
MAYLRIVMNGLIQNQFLFCPELKKNIESRGIKWKYCVSVCTDSAPSMLACKAMDFDHKCFLYHTEVRWLSKGRVLERVIFLRVEIVFFFDTKDTDRFNDAFGGLKFRF